MIEVFGDLKSGNCYKVRLLLAQRGMPFKHCPVDVVRGEQRSAAFQKLNPNLKTPTVRLGDGRLIWESGAILFHFAQDSPYWPNDPWDQTKVLQWMFFEQYTHEPAIAVARFICTYLNEAEKQAERLQALRQKGTHALQVMELHLSEHEWFAGDQYSIADIALYAYTHCADEGGFDLSLYPNIQSWLKRVQSTPGYVPIGWQP